MPVSPLEAAARSKAFHTYPAELVHELSFDLGKPHTLTAINALTLRGTAEDVALQVWLYLALHRLSYLGLVFSIGLKLCSHHLG